MRLRCWASTTTSPSSAPTPPIRTTPLRKINPLGKIPVLIVEDGSAIYDSRVILDYLDDRAGGGKIVPRDVESSGSPRCACRRCATASSMPRSSPSTRAAIASPKCTSRNGSNFRPARCRARSPCSKRRRRRSIPMPNVGQIALACALGYRDFRFGGSWRGEHPRLVAWLDNFAGARAGLRGDQARVMSCAAYQ